MGKFAKLAGVGAVAMAAIVGVVQIASRSEHSVTGTSTLELSADERRIQTLVAKFSYVELLEMWMDAYKAVEEGKDSRPESIKNEKLLFEAQKRARPKPELSKMDAVNEKLRGL